MLPKVKLGLHRSNNLIQVYSRDSIYLNKKLCFFHLQINLNARRVTKQIIMFNVLFYLYYSTFWVSIFDIFNNLQKK